MTVLKIISLTLLTSLTTQGFGAAAAAGEGAAGDEDFRSKLERLHGNRESF